MSKAIVSLAEETGDTPENIVKRAVGLMSLFQKKGVLSGKLKLYLFDEESKETIEVTNF